MKMKKNFKYITLIIFVTLIVVYAIPKYETAGNGNELYITSDSKQQVEAGTFLTDDELLTLFNVTSNYQELFNGTLSIEHNINFNTPGTYNIKFIASYQEILCFDDKDDEDGKGTGKNENGTLIGTYCQNNADDGEVGNNDRYKYIDKQKVATSKLTVTEKAQTTIIADSYHGDNEHTVYSDAELIELYNVQVLGANQEPITISHNIDFTTPGQYQITFTSDGIIFVSTYEVYDLKPSLDSLDKYTIQVGETVDYVSAYQIVATELNSGDLNSNLKVHDSHIDYNVPGNYYLNISVSDKEGNVVIKEIQLIIEGEEEQLVLSSKPTKTIELGTTFTDEELINQFEVAANYQLNKAELEVEHNIDYSQIGSYQITFSDNEYGLQTTSILTIREPIMKSLKIDKMCVNQGTVLTKAGYIEEYTKQVGAINDQSVLDSLEIDDSQVDYQTVGTYQVNVIATNEIGTVISKVLALCITSDNDTSSEVDEEVSEVDEEVSEVDEEVSEVDEEASEVDEEVSEVDDVPTISDGVICVANDNLDKINFNLNRKIDKVYIPQSDIITDNMLRTLFEQPEDVTVIHNIVPTEVGEYEVGFESGECGSSGTVVVSANTQITSKQDLENYLAVNNLNEIESDEIKEGTYSIVKLSADGEEQHYIEYKLLQTGSENNYIAMIVLALGGLVVLILASLLIRKTFS